MCSLSDVLNSRVVSCFNEMAHAGATPPCHMHLRGGGGGHF